MAQTARRTRRSAEMQDDEDDPPICTHAGNKIIPGTARPSCQRASDQKGDGVRLRPPPQAVSRHRLSIHDIIVDHYTHVVLARLRRLAMQRRVDFTHFSRISQE